MHPQQQADIEPGVSIEAYRPRDGDHLCSLWTVPSADRRAAAAFLGAAVEHEQALWILDRARGNVAATEAIDTGVPPVARFTTDQVYVAGGLFDPQRMRQFWTDRSVEAHAEGASHLRAVAEMTWALRALPGTQHAPSFESSLNPLFAGLPASVICQYGSVAFDAKTLLAMVLSHPLVVIGDLVFRNAFFVDDDDFESRFNGLKHRARDALLPVWRHYVALMPSPVYLAQFLCSSLSTFLDVEEVWVSFEQLPEPVAIAVATDSAGPASHPPLGEESLQRRGRLHAMWPGTYGSVGAAVQRAPAGAPGALDVTYNNGVGRVVVSRGRGFENGEISMFTTMATSIAEALVSSGA